MDIHTGKKPPLSLRDTNNVCHREANEALVILPQQICGDIGELLSQKHSDQKVKNQQMFMKILQSLRYLARQGLVLKGCHVDDTERNFCQFFQLQVKDMNTWD